MDPPSLCRLHPGVAVTGFCPACLRDRLAGLQPPSAADLRRCKSFSYARSSSAIYLQSQQLEPQRRSCDLFRQEQQPVIAVPEEDVVQRRTEAEPSRKSSSFGALLGKKLKRQWGRRQKKEPPPIPEEMMMPGRHRQHSFRDVDGRRDPVSWDAAGSVHHHLPPAAMLSSSLSVEEDYDNMPPVPRSDGQIPVEDEDYMMPVPGGCVQTRDYYLDSSSSSRRRRSVDISGRNSFSSDVNNSELPSSMMTTNARVSPAAIAAEFYHAHQRVLVHGGHQYRSRDRDQPCSKNYNNPRDDFSGTFGGGAPAPANKPNKKGIKGWSIWGLIHKKSSSRKPEAAGQGSSAPAADQVVEYPWPELRARGYNGQMLRCNSSISARSSFSGGTAAMIGGSARRSISGMETIQHDAHGGSGRTRRRDDVLLQERNLSSTTRSSSYSRYAGHDHPMGAGKYQQFSWPNHNGVRSSSKSKPASALPRRSTLGPYSTDPIPRQY